MIRLYNLLQDGAIRLLWAHTRLPVFSWQDGLIRLLWAHTRLPVFSWQDGAIRLLWAEVTRLRAREERKAAVRLQVVGCGERER